MTDREVMQMALEALENAQANFGEYWPEVVAAMREAQKHQQQALQRMADNARELGLDYEPQQEPVAGLKQCLHPWCDCPDECVKPQQEAQATHSADCYRWHHQCAIAEVERLRKQPRHRG